MLLFPVSKDVLTCFIAYFYKEGLKVDTINSYCHTQIALDPQDPHMEGMSWLKYVMFGVNRITNRPTSRRLPITLYLLAQVHHFWCAERSSRDSTMVWWLQQYIFLWILKCRRYCHTSRLTFGFKYTFGILKKGIGIESKNHANKLGIK